MCVPQGSDRESAALGHLRESRQQWAAVRLASVWPFGTQGEYRLALHIVLAWLHALAMVRLCVTPPKILKSRSDLDCWCRVRAVAVPTYNLSVVRQ